MLILSLSTGLAGVVLGFLLRTWFHRRDQQGQTTSARETPDWSALLSRAQANEQAERQNAAHFQSLLESERARLVQNQKDEEARRSRTAKVERVLEAEIKRLRSRVAVLEERLPAGCDEPTDDLKEIFGIGPVLEQRLHAMGIYSFRQIACWTDADVRRVQDRLVDFKDRILWDNWVENARELHERKYGTQLAA